MLGRGRWWRSVRGVLVGGALAAAACSGGGGSGDDGGESADDDRVDRADRTSPLDEFFESMGSGEQSDQEIADEQRQVEAQVADCMEAQGFEYTPVHTDWSTISAEEDDGPWSLPEDEFAERYGYGIFTIDFEEDLADTPEDPNQERVDAMSEAERAAYEEALWGQFDEETGETIGTGGCQGEAWAAVTGMDPTSEEDNFDALWEEMDALWERIESDPRVAEAARGWSDCMADAGYPDLENPESAQELVNQRYEDMNPEAPEDVPLDDMEDEESDEAMAYPSGDPMDGWGLEPEQLEELRSFEIEVAVADYDCRADYDDVRFEVQVELEEQFIEANQDELDRYREAYASAGDG